MAWLRSTVYLKCLIICTSLFSLATGLNLNQGSSKPRTTKFTATTESGSEAQLFAGTTTIDNTGIPVYRYTKGDITCILLKTDGLVEVKFKLHGSDEQADSFIPAKPLVEGNCNEDSSFMRISWTGYSLVIPFSKTPGGDRWYISNLVLTVSADLPQLIGVQTHGKSAIKLYHKDTLIATPVGKSYTCENLKIDLKTDLEDNPPPEMRGTLFLRLLQVQPFMYKGSDFEPAIDCKFSMSFRDETAPIAVGSTLAVAVLMTVTGYGIYRKTVKNGFKRRQTTLQKTKTTLWS